MTKRAMTKEEKQLVGIMCEDGCIICGREAQFHHLPTARPYALAMGYPLCLMHHQGEEYPGQSIHSSRMLFTATHGTELELAQKAITRAFRKTIPF